MAGRDEKRIASLVAKLQDTEDPIERLDLARRVAELAQRLEDATVDQARAAGRTWLQVGAVYGLTKQGAQQRFRQEDDRTRRRRA